MARDPNGSLRITLLRNAPWIVGPALLAFVARAIYIVLGSGKRLFGVVFQDSEIYVETAAQIARGAGAGDHPYLLSPLYPYLLSPFVDSSGRLAIDSVQWLQAVAGSLTVALTALIAWRVAGRTAGLLAGLVAALYGPLIYHDGAILVASLQTLFITAGLAFLVFDEARRGPACWAGAGLAFGVSAALRPTGLAMGLAAVGLLWIGAATFRRGREPLRRPLLKSAALLIGMAVVIAPFAARNVRQSGERVLLSANGGFNFFIGNHANAIGLFASPTGYDLENDPVGVDFVTAALGRDVSYVEASRWWRDQAVSDIREGPLRWLRLLVRKSLYFGHPHEIAQMVQDFVWHRDLVWVLRLPLDARVVLLLALLAPVALVLEGRRREWERLMWPLYMLLVFAGLVALFFVTSRHRIPIMPAAIVLASSTVVSGWGLLRASWRERSRAGLALVGVFAVLMGASVWLYDLESGPLHLTFPQHEKFLNQALVLAKQGRLGESIEHFRRSLELKDNPAARFDLAGVLLKMGRTKQAKEELEAAVALRPDHVEAWFNIGLLRQTREHDFPGAREAYRRALQADASLDRAWFRLGEVELELGDPAQALAAFQQFMALAAPDNPLRREADAKARLAALLLSQRQPPAPIRQGRVGPT